MTSPSPGVPEFKLGVGVIEVTSNTKLLRADLRQGVASATKGEKIVLPVELDRDLHRKIQTDLKKATANFDEIKLDASTSEVDKKIEKLRGELVSLSGKKIGVDIEAAEAIREITRIRRELDRLALQSPTVKVKADTATAVVKLAAIELQIAKINDTKIEPKIEPKIGLITANKFASEFSKDVSTALSRFDIATPISTAMVGSISAIAAVAPIAAAGVLALGSSFGLAAASSAAALPAFLGLGAGIGVTVLAFSRVKTAMKDYVDTSGMTAEQAKKANEKFAQSLSKLSPAGREFVLTLVGMRGELKKFQSDAEQVVLPAFTSALKDVRTILPDLNLYMQQFGYWIGVAVTDLSSFVQSPVFRGQLKNIMAENVEAAKLFTLGLSPIPGILTSVAEAAAPLLPRLAGAFESSMRMLDVWIETRRESGQLSAFFQRAGDEAAKWGGIVTNTVIGIARIFGYASGEGQNLSSSLLSITERFREWSGTQQARDGVIATFEYVRNIDYQRILAIAAAVSTLSIAVKSFGIAQGIGGVVSSLASLGPAGIVVGTIALAVTALAAAFGYLYVQSEPVRTSINNIVSAVRDQLGPVFEQYRSMIVDRLAPAIEDVLAGALGKFRDFLVTSLLPALREAYDTYLPSLEHAFNTIRDSLKDNKTEIETFLSWGGRLLGWVVEGIPRFAKFASVLVDLVAGAISTVVDTIGWLVDAVHAVGGFFTDVGDTAVRVWRSVTSFFSGTAGTVGAAAKSTGDWLGRVGDKISEVWGSVTGFFSDVASTVSDTSASMRDAVFGAFDWIYSKITGVLSAVYGFVSPIFDAIGGVVSAGADIVRQIFVGIFDWIDQVTGGRISGLISTISLGFSTIVGYVTGAGAWISAAWDSTWSSVTGATSAAWSWLTGIVMSAVGTVSSVISAAGSWIASAWDSTWSTVTGATSSAWNWISNETSSALSTLRGAISSALNTISGFFSGMWSTVRSGWDSAWSWMTDKARTAVDGIKGVATGIRDGFVSAINGIPRAIVAGINAMLDLVNGAIGLVNKILPDRLDLPPLGHVNVPAGYATGGRIAGRGTGTSDSIPIMASNGEFVLRARAVNALQGAYGAGFLDFLNNYDVSGDPSAARLRPRGFSGGGIVDTQNFIRGTDPLSYVFGDVGPGAYDCSGLVGEVWARLTGHPSYQRYFTTDNVATGGFGFQPGHGTFTIGLSPTHVVGNLGGLGFEAKGSQYGILVGSAARSVDSMPSQYYLPSMGGQFYDSGAGGGFFADLVGKAIDKIMSPIKDKLPNPGGIVSPLVAGLFDTLSSGVKHLSFDQGGPLYPGPTLAANFTGHVEQVLTPQEIADLKLAASGGGGSVTYRFESGSITLDASKIKDIEDLVEMIDGLATSARRFGG
jgi:phage-related protein